MKYDPEKHHRRSIRLRGYDYASAGAYYVTIVTQGRECLFGEIVGEQTILNDYGRIVQKWWDDLPIHFPCVETGAFVIMPNHVHGIIIINDRRGAVPAPDDKPAPNDKRAPNDVMPIQDGISTQKPGGETPPLRVPTLGQVVVYFKYKSTKEMNTLDTPGVIKKLWQRNYHEHIIRNDDDYNRIHLYIESNPLNWMDDDENPVKKR